MGLAKLQKFVDWWNTSCTLKMLPVEFLEQHCELTKQSVMKQFAKKDQESDKHNLRMSTMGYPAVEIAMKKLAAKCENEDTTLSRQWIFHLGDYVESLLIMLMKTYGLDVQYCQEEVVYCSEKQKVVGHIDCVVEGVLVDVKTMGYYIRNFREHPDDDRGYITQGHLYLECMKQLGCKKFYWLCLDKFTNRLELIEMEWDDYYLERVDYILECLPKIKKFDDIADYFDVPALEINGHKKEVPQCMRYSEFKHLFYVFDGKGRPIRTAF